MQISAKRLFRQALYQKASLNCNTRHNIHALNAEGSINPILWIYHCLLIHTTLKCRSLCLPGKILWRWTWTRLILGNTIMYVITDRIPLLPIFDCVSEIELYLQQKNTAFHIQNQKLWKAEKQTCALVVLSNAKYAFLGILTKQMVGAKPLYTAFSLT